MHMRLRKGACHALLPALLQTKVQREQAWQLGLRLKQGQDALTRADALQRGLTELLIAGAAVAMLWTSWRLSQVGAFDALRTVPVVLAVTITSFNAAIGLNNVVNDFKVSLVSARRLFELMDQRPVVQDTAAAGPRAADAAVRRPIGFGLSNVSFSYLGEGGQGARTVLRDVSVEVPAGRHVALVGASGAGKSTIANLLLRFWDATGGTVTVDGERRLPLQSNTSARPSCGATTSGATFDAERFTSKPVW